jgi:hypothetical protein
MAQYRPEHKAVGHDKLGRSVNEPEMTAAINYFLDRGMKRLDHRFTQYNVCGPMLMDKLGVLFQKDMDW